MQLALRRLQRLAGSGGDSRGGGGGAAPLADTTRTELADDEVRSPARAPQRPSPPRAGEVPARVSALATADDDHHDGSGGGAAPPAGGMRQPRQWALPATAGGFNLAQHTIVGDEDDEKRLRDRYPRGL